MGRGVEVPCGNEGPAEERLHLLAVLLESVNTGTICEYWSVLLLFYNNMDTPGRSVLSSSDGGSRRARRSGTN